MDRKTTSAQADRHYLLIRSAGLRCALPAPSVRRVVRDLASYPLAGSRPHLLGLSQYGGEPLAIVDLHALLTGSRPRPDHRTTLIVKPPRGPLRGNLGLAVDEAVSVIRLDHDDRSSEGAALVAAEINHDGGPLLILTPAVLFDDDWQSTEGVDGRR
jgi:chemotaxis signal transduction protein